MVFCAVLCLFAHDCRLYVFNSSMTGYEDKEVQSEEKAQKSDQLKKPWSKEEKRKEKKLKKNRRRGQRMEQGAPEHTRAR